MKPEREIMERKIVWRVTIAAAQAAGNMPNHWVVKLEMTDGYVQLVPCHTYEEAVICAQSIPMKYEIGGFIEEEG
jgi:hypothetical protein